VILKELSLGLFWFLLVKKIIEKSFSFSSGLVLNLDKTQWQNTNILIIS
jgi:predicted oxidoreductase